MRSGRTYARFKIRLVCPIATRLHGTLTASNIKAHTGKFSAAREWTILTKSRGEGRMFTSTLSSAMSGKEFAATVSTLPMADQQMIRTLIGGILGKRGR